MASLFVVTPEEIAAKLGVTVPLSDADRAVIEAAITDCQADVEAELNRSIVPTQQTLQGVWPRLGYDLMDWRAWPQASEVYDDDIKPEFMTANPDGSYDVTFTVGLDGANTPPVKRYVKAHTIESIRNDPDSGIGTNRLVTSVSAEGQSVSYATASVDAGAAGSLPNIKTLRAFKRRAVFRANRAGVSIWPNSGVRYTDTR